METLLDALREALRLLIDLDPALVEIIGMTLRVTGTALLLAVLLGLPLGATRLQLATALLLEARLGVLAAIIAAFGGIVSEVGAVMLVGGNIEGQTRVLTTAIVLETRRGNFALALALGIILLLLAFLTNWLFHKLSDG